MKHLPGIFNNVIGPVMRGPSSSHTAASWRIARIALDILNDGIQKALVEFDRDGAWAPNYREQGTCMGINGGLLGLGISDERMKDTDSYAHQLGIEITYQVSSFKTNHPNTVRLTLEGSTGKKIQVTAVSTGGGSFELRSIDGCHVDFKGDQIELLLLSHDQLDISRDITIELPSDLSYLGTQVEGLHMYRCSSSHSFSSKLISYFKKHPGISDLTVIHPVMPVITGKETELPFDDIQSLIAYADKNAMNLAQLGMMYEKSISGMTDRELKSKMASIIEIIENSIDTGIKGTQYKDRILPQQSHLIASAEKEGRIRPSIVNQMISYVSAIMEAKSAVEVIVAVPTAGACGTVGGSVHAVSKDIGCTGDQLIDAYFAAGIIGAYFAQGPGFSAEEHGCQVECGAASGMAAAAIVQLYGGTAKQGLDAASMAIQNMIGLVCDPVADRVEVPCLGKNISAAVNAYSAAIMAISGFDAVIPLEQVIQTVSVVSNTMPVCVKCTGKGGLAITKASHDIRKKLVNMKRKLILLITICLSLICQAQEYHVAITGNDQNSGTDQAPFLTIQRAANVAQPGDVITVHEGVYREHVNPPRGGKSNAERITYQAAEGEKAEIKGSEIIKSWVKFHGSVWKASIPNSFFGEYNPYKDLVGGDWFNDKGRIHHTGEVYLNGKSLWEMEILEKVLNPEAVEDNYDPIGSSYTWYCESDDENTYIYANFHEADPSSELVEINVRRTCFYPDSNNIDYISVRGFHMSQAATQWAPPTAEQIGLIGTNWSKGWIIENNVIRNSKCSGITMGKHGDKWDNTSENSAVGYVETIRRATERGWSKEHIGSHIIQNNTISDCEQTGICGSMGAVFSIIENNDIYNIWTKRQWTGAEMGGIKIHASIDMLIKNNRLYNCGRGLWLDWMAQGTRVTGNLLYANSTDDLFVEVNHGPFLVENNILLSDLAIRDWSQGGAFVHNLIKGNIQVRPQARETPYHLPHSTEVLGLATTKCGDNRYFNNIFIGGSEENGTNVSGLGAYKNAELPMFVNGNVYLSGAKKYIEEENQLEIDADPGFQIEEGDDIYLSMEIDRAIFKMNKRVVNTELMGKAKISGQRFDTPDGINVTIDKDYLGNTRKVENPSPGPFRLGREKSIHIKIWPK